MSLNSIYDLAEVESSALTDNDFVAVGTQSGWKKIKANSLGGSESPIEVIEVDYNGGALRTILTAGEIKALAEQGKVFMIAVAPQPGVLSYANVASLVLDDNGCTMDIYVVNDGTFTSIGLSASSDNDVLTV